VPLASLPPSFRTAYQVWVRRGWDPARVEIYRAPLRERLPDTTQSLRFCAFPPMRNLTEYSTGSEP